MKANGTTHDRIRPSARPVVITGGAGFIGCNLADRLASEQCEVVVFDAMLRPGVVANAEWLKRRHPERIKIVVGDVRDRDAVASVVGQCGAVFHLAAQVAVTTSLDDPRSDFDTNLSGTVILLEALRRLREAPPLIYASTNKVYGDLADIPLRLQADAYTPEDPVLRQAGIDESRALAFHTPYGCSKGGADQYVLDYARSLGLRTLVFRMSCIFGRRQLGTEDQGWVAHFARRAIAGTPLTIYGDGRQVRDLLYVDDAVDAYMAAWRRIDEVSGRAFNLGGGPANSVSVMGVVHELESLLGRTIDCKFESWRAGDQRYFVADARRARAALGLAQSLAWREGLERLLHWLLDTELQPHRTAAGATRAEATL